MVREAVHVGYRNQKVGAVGFDTESGIGTFQYDPAFLTAGIELSPLKMPLANTIYSFPELSFRTFKGLPGLLADALPDDFGNAVLNAWAARNGRNPEDLTPLQRLQYTGRRGMGALEYIPATRTKNLNASQQLEIASLVRIAQDILDARKTITVELTEGGSDNREAMAALLSVGTSAGGARPKAVLAFNDDFTRVRSGQTDIPEGFTHFLLKFDGVREHSEGEETFGDPLGFGAMEYTYHQMARACGIRMMPCRLLDEGPRRHFVTQRFDRRGNEKIHVQTLNGLAHVDYRKPGSFSYEELLGIARRMRLSAEEAVQLFRRMVFNIVARNHDDHSKNTSFMLAGSTWTLAPAYDLAYSYKPGSSRVNIHWMSLNGKRDYFVRSDFHVLEKLSPVFTKRKINGIIDEVVEHISQWEPMAIENGVPASLIGEITKNLRLTL